MLNLPKFKDIAELLIDGKSVKRKALAPYCFKLPQGKHNISLRIWNTMGNQLERFSIPSGLTAAPEIVR